MRKINLFLGSSIIELKEERQAFTEIIAELNTKLEPQDCFIYLRTCGNLNGNIEEKGSQQKLDEDILKSQYSYFIVKKKFGQYTEHEFNIALKQFNYSGSPKINVLFSHNNELSNEAASFQERLKQIGHYYKVYKNKEEIKLNIILNLIVDDYILSKDLSIEEGGVYIDSIKLIDTEQIPIYSKHSQLHRLRQQMKKLERKEKNTSDKRELRIIREKIRDITLKIREIEHLIYQTLLGLTKAGRGQMTPLLSRAIGYLERGDIERAADILNIDDVTDELNGYMEKTELSIEGLQAAIDTTYIAIETMMQMPESIENTHHIESLFEKIIAMEVEYNLNRKHCGLYVRYLLQRKKIEQAEKYILLYLEAPDVRIDTVNDFIQSEYSLLGMHMFLEPFYTSDKERYQMLYVKTAFGYLQMYDKALEKLENDSMHISPIIMGMHCDRLNNTLKNWIGEKDSEILSIEKWLQEKLNILQMVGYKSETSEIDGAQAAKTLIARMELQAECEKLNDEPCEENPKQYLEAYIDKRKRLHDYFNNSDNIYLKNNPTLDKLEKDYKTIESALQKGNDDVLLIYAQIKIGYAEHFANVENYTEAKKDYLAAYNAIKQLAQPLDPTCCILLIHSCQGVAITLSHLNNYEDAESFIREGIQICKDMGNQNPTTSIMLARMYTNYVTLCLNGRIENCISKGLEYSHKAYCILDNIRNNLNESELILFSNLCYLYSVLLMENGNNKEAYDYLLEAFDFFNMITEECIDANRDLVNRIVINSLQLGKKLNRKDDLKPKLESLYGVEITQMLFKKYFDTE